MSILSLIPQSDSTLKYLGALTNSYIVTQNVPNEYFKLGLNAVVSIATVWIYNYYQSKKHNQK